MTAIPCRWRCCTRRLAYWKPSPRPWPAWRRKGYVTQPDANSLLLTTAGRQARPPVDPDTREALLSGPITAVAAAADQKDQTALRHLRPHVQTMTGAALPAADENTIGGHPPDYRPAPAGGADRMRRISPAAGVVGGKERPSANLIAGDAMEPFRTSFPPFRPPPNGCFAPVSCYNLGKKPLSETDHA
ncbi:MAG: hypothetical protein R6X34_29240 [Chloroflexota bacterium]